MHLFTPPLLCAALESHSTPSSVGKREVHLPNPFQGACRIYCTVCDSVLLNVFSIWNTLFPQTNSPSSAAHSFPTSLIRHWKERNINCRHDFTTNRYVIILAVHTQRQHSMIHLTLTCQLSERQQAPLLSLRADFFFFDTNDCVCGWIIWAESHTQQQEQKGM